MSSEKGVSIGIDLGTTYSCVGVFQHGKVEIIANDQGNMTPPSDVAVTNTQRLIGDAAKNQVAMNPTITVFDAKTSDRQEVQRPDRSVRHETVAFYMFIYLFTIFKNTSSNL
nr:heat shock 70 kDa protein cognate 1-like [Salvelinus alpinus]